jgi:Tfp pilus assembly protein PilF
MRPAEEALRLAEAAALKALEHDPTDAEAQASAAFATMVKRSEEGIPERLAHALASNPNSPWVHGMQGAFLVWNGRTSEGRRHLEIALRLIPLP